jgi:hypothetical protein
MLCAHCNADTAADRCPSCGEDPRLEDRYALEAVVGRGAAATLYRAVDQRTGGAVAIKERHPQGMLDDEADRLFRREVAVLQQLDHPRIPDYVDAFASGRGRARRHYLVQELVDGRSLDVELAGRRLDERGVLDIVASVAEILVYLHGLAPPVIHRDIKPGNVVRRRDGALVLVDFGAVRDTLPGTLGGDTVAGTFGFMAPEQFMGDAVPASDVYALGALAVALLSREDPARLHDRARRFRWREAVSISDGAAALLGRMLAEEPGARPTAAEVVRAVEALRSNPAEPEIAPAAPVLAGPAEAALDRLAARGLSLRAMRAEREQKARLAADATKARAEAEAADKRLREGLLPPGVAWIPNHQMTMQIGGGTAFVMGTLAATIGVLTGMVEALRAVGVSHFLLDLGMIPCLMGAMLAGFLVWFFAFERALALLCRAASGVELRRLEQLPVALELEPYLEGLSAFHHSPQVQLRIALREPPSAAVVEKVRNALAGAGVDGAVSVVDGAVILTSPEVDVTSYHGKRLEHVISHHAYLHAWTRRALARVLVPARASLGIGSIRPQVVSR